MSECEYECVCVRACVCAAYVWLSHAHVYSLPLLVAPIEVSPYTRFLPVHFRFCTDAEEWGGGIFTATSAAATPATACEDHGTGNHGTDNPSQGQQ